MADHRPLGRAATIDLLERHGLRPRKALGQHFLADPNIVDKIVSVAGIGPEDRVVEVGAGVGTLTRGLAAAGAAVTAFEIDERLRPVLGEALAGMGVEVYFEDAARIDFSARLAGGPWVMVANLPYNVGTPLLMDLLRRVPQIERFVVMLQREAVERLAARPGSKAYGLPSVVARLHGDVEVAFRVPASVFVPPPKVESAVAMIRRHTTARLADEAVTLAAAGFGQRRKMLRSSLRTVLGDPVTALEAAGLDPTNRAEDVGPDGYRRLAEVVHAS